MNAKNGQKNVEILYNKQKCYKNWASEENPQTRAPMIFC